MREPEGDTKGRSGEWKIENNEEAKAECGVVFQKWELFALFSFFILHVQFLVPLCLRGNIDVRNAGQDRRFQGELMNNIRRLAKFGVVAAGLTPIFGACVTTNQLQDFIRSEIAAVSTQILTEPITNSLIDLTGPQVVEEVVPSL